MLGQIHHIICGSKLRIDCEESLFMGGIDLLNFLTKTSSAFGPDTGSCIFWPRTIFGVVSAGLL